MDMMRRCSILATALVALGTMSALGTSAQPLAIRSYAPQIQQDGSWLQYAASREAAKLPRGVRRAVPAIPVPGDQLCTSGFSALVYHPPEILASGVKPPPAASRLTSHVQNRIALRLGGKGCGNGLAVRWT
jgi:hypothetical protein